MKQTSDATLDSRILVDAAEIVFNKAKKMAFGANAAQGIDVDEFVGKLITYMRNSPDAGRLQLREGRGRVGAGVDDEDGGGGGGGGRGGGDADEGDALDWAYLGRTAAFKGNKRPATSDFLLGPLSVTKRARLQKARSQGLKRNANNIVRPQELRAEEIQKNEFNSTTKLVMAIATILDQYLIANDLTDEGEGVNYFKFVINPHSFGQTVENIFYVSFLVRDGRAAVWEDEDDGMPYLGLAEQMTPEEAKERGVLKQQVITSLDMWSWRELVRALGITDSIIPMREDEGAEVVGEGGWYS